MKMIIGKHETRGVPVYIIVLALVLAICFFITAIHEVNQTKGMIEWYSIKEINKAENLVLINVSTEWYEPCKAMDKYTFKDNEVASIITTEFFPVRIDGDDSLGLVFCEDYKITAFPTLLIIEPDTKRELKRLVGFQTRDALIRELNNLIETEIE